jgi:NhaP-type Na+/H+ or K+/H+ antiporter
MAILLTNEPAQATIHPLNRLKNPVMVMGAHLPGNDTILATVAWTIVLSIVAHGLTANSLASVYGARVDHRGGEI